MKNCETGQSRRSRSATAAAVRANMNHTTDFSEYVTVVKARKKKDDVQVVHDMCHLRAYEERKSIAKIRISAY